jgi:hypothetical protein
MMMMMMMSGFIMGWSINGLKWEARYAALQKTHAEETSARDRAIAEAIDKVREMERQGDAIAARLLTAEAARQKLAKEKDDAIKSLTAGRPCLATPVVRLLNYPASTGAGVSLSAAASDPAHPDSAFATDTDVGLWARLARDAHDSCRTRIDALREFFGEAE